MIVKFKRKLSIEVKKRKIKYGRGVVFQKR